MIKWNIIEPFYAKVDVFDIAVTEENLVTLNDQWVSDISRAIPYESVFDIAVTAENIAKPNRQPR